MIKRSVILCEGIDEIYILGYYLNKTNNWNRAKDGKNFSEKYSLKPSNHRRQAIEFYTKEDDKLAIWSVGGKDSFFKPLKTLKKLNQEQPTDIINQIFIIQDRDDDEISVALEELRIILEENGINIPRLKNNQENIWNFEEEGDEYTISFIPIILPFDEKGAIETLLMKSISEGGKEEEYIVSQAKKYIDDFILPERKINKFLTHKREVLKGKFSAVISVTNPERSTAVFNKLLMSHEWEKKESIKRHFELLEKLL